ncbi:MAG: flagellar motor protein MotD [Thioalkalivibrionaceae bacterium]
MARRRHQEEHVNHEAWAIPYGDFVTLLLAFFVVMYAISSVNEGQYRVLSDSLVAAFQARPTVEPIQIGDPSLAIDWSSEDIARSLAPIVIAPTGPTTQALSESVDQEAIEIMLRSALEADTAAPARGTDTSVLAQIAAVADDLEALLAPLIDDDLIAVRRDDWWLEIEINTELLFSSGSARLNNDARPILTSVASLLAKRPAQIHVEGHTDDVPIRTPVYPSNWELSSARAASVVALFETVGIDPSTMVAIGHGEHKPIADNATPEGRTQNRRVVIVVIPAPRPRDHQDIIDDDEGNRPDDVGGAVESLSQRAASLRNSTIALEARSPIDRAAYRVEEV